MQGDLSKKSKNQVDQCAAEEAKHASDQEPLDWAVAALKRASALGYGSREEVDRLARDLLSVLNGPALARQGLPGFCVEASTGKPLEPARGAGNSGILSMAAELDPKNASQWFMRYAEQYWKEGWVSGFREAPRGTELHEDADSGPLLFGVGTVATGLGIGAARSVGRFDYAVPIAMETVPASWPTPFGMLLPGFLGWVAADGWCFGELALLFSMTRPNMVGHVVPYQGGVPNMVWVFLVMFLAGAVRPAWEGWRALRKGYLGCEVGNDRPPLRAPRRSNSCRTAAERASPARRTQRATRSAPLSYP